MKLPAALRVALWPASLIWGAAVRLRSAGYKWGLLRARRLPGVVISVGNLTAGGTGKTPMVLWLAEKLRADGKRVGILTRGYRSRTEVSGGAPQSDEVAIYRERLGHHVELGVGADRYSTGEVLARHGVECFILDDGFQHLQLERNANIVLLDATNPFGGGMLLPAGLLREPKRALERADVIVITRSEHALAVESVVGSITTAPIFYATTALREVLPITGTARRIASEDTSSDWRTKRALAFCGIGNPRAFFEDLRSWGAAVVGTAAFPDHHAYTSRDAERLEAKARESGAEIMLCTEKDVFNLREIQFTSLPVYFARIELRVLDADGFWNAIQTAIERSQERMNA